MDELLNYFEGRSVDIDKLIDALTVVVFNRQYYKKHGIKVDMYLSYYDAVTLFRYDKDEVADLSIITYPYRLELKEIDETLWVGVYDRNTYFTVPTISFKV